MKKKFFFPENLGRVSILEKKIIKKNPMLLLFEDQSNNIILPIFVPTFRGWQNLCRVFFSSLPRSVSVSREGKRGRGVRTDLTLALNLVDPPTPHLKLPIGHDSCFSHKHFSLIIHGLIVLTCTFRRSRGVLEEGGCGITLPFALAYWAIAYISGISSKFP